MFCNIEISLNDKLIKTTAMIDTGNLLKDPISNFPVIVVEHTLLYDCIPKEILNNLENILGGNLENIPEDIRNEYMLKLKVIPYMSLGKQNGMLLGIKPENVKIEREEDVKCLDKVIIGIYNKSLTKRGEYRALLGIEML
jgi:stage II sporulation protein GA (sporulation sigma-E factor processing peptidase)